MKKAVSLLLCILLLLSVFVAGASAAASTGWGAQDGLGRTLSTYEQTGGKREDRFVGMFYWIWHYPWCESFIPRNVTQTLKLYPEAVNDYNHFAWTDNMDGCPYFWDEPLYGYYSDLDEYVLRKHAELLADADIDVIIFDATNGTQTFWEGLIKLCEVFELAKKDGIDVPKIAYMLNFFNEDEIRTEILQLYNDFYKKGLYEDLWFYWEGKPFIMADGSVLSRFNTQEKEAAQFFTFRKNEATYFAEDTLQYQNTWGWCSEYPQTKFGVDILGNVEQMCVSVAQNANEDGLSAMNNPKGTVQGRGYAKGNYSYTYQNGDKTVTVNQTTPNVKLYGLNFQQQWDYAIKTDPEFIFVTGFNEWIAGRFMEWEGTSNAFPDQFNTEYSRDIEPSAGELKDYFYYQLVENVRRYKGCEEPLEVNTQKTVVLTDGAEQWDEVTPTYTHYTSSVKVRDFDGWKGTHYYNDTVNNDIVSAKVCHDKDNLYFTVETAENLTGISNGNFMRLFLDTEANGIEEGWESFEYYIHDYNEAQHTASVSRFVNGWESVEVGQAQFTVNGNRLTLSVCKKDLDLDNKDTLNFGFKWSDNMQTDGDIMDFYENGDVAPGGRFTFRFTDTPVSAPEVKQAKGLWDRLIGWLADILVNLLALLAGTC